MPIREMEKVKGKETDPPLAHPFLRATLGINILIHGATSILGGPGSFATMLAQGFSRHSPATTARCWICLHTGIRFFLMQFIWPSSPSASRFLP